MCIVVTVTLSYTFITFLPSSQLSSSVYRTRLDLYEEREHAFIPGSAQSVGSACPIIDYPPRRATVTVHSETDLPL